MTSLRLGRRLVHSMDLLMTHQSLDCLIHELYATAVREPDDDALWDRLPQGLAQVLGLPLVLLGHYEPQGIITVLGTSRASQLWSALQRLPERWDGSVVGRGLAALALESRSLATLALEDERFVCWRDGAEHDGLRSGAALFVEGALGRFVIELFSPQPAAFGEDFGQRLLDVRARLLDFLDDLARLREQHLLARALERAGNAAFITDREGTIVWCNDAFTRLYGYSRREAVGQNPRFLKSGKQGVRYYRDLWSTIRSGRVWAGETVDRDRNGIPYTVRQTITPFARDEQLSHFLAIHDDISRENRARLRQELRTGVDPLTGLLTRAAFEAQLDERDASDPEAEWSLLLVSMQEFQEGVASLGNELAEAIFAQVGARIREAMGEHATAGCLAPGEFGIQVLRDGAVHVQEVADRLIDALSRPFPQLPPAVLAQPRIAAAHHPADGRSFDSLIQHADRQLANRPMARARL